MEKSILLKNASGQDLINLKNVRGDQQLDLSELPNGVYFLTCTGKSLLITEKIVIQK